MPGTNCTCACTCTTCDMCCYMIVSNSKRESWLGVAVVASSAASCVFARAQHLSRVSAKRSGTHSRRGYRPTVSCGLASLFFGGKRTLRDANKRTAAGTCRTTQETPSRRPQADRRSDRRETAGTASTRNQSGSGKPLCGLGVNFFSQCAPSYNGPATASTPYTFAVGALSPDPLSCHPGRSRN